MSNPISEALAAVGGSLLTGAIVAWRKSRRPASGDLQRGYRARDTIARALHEIRARFDGKWAVLIEAHIVDKILISTVVAEVADGPADRSAAWSQHESSDWYKRMVLSLPQGGGRWLPTLEMQDPALRAIYDGHGGAHVFSLHANGSFLYLAICRDSPEMSTADIVALTVQVVEIKSAYRVVAPAAPPGS